MGKVILSVGLQCGCFCLWGRRGQARAPAIGSEDLETSKEFISSLDSLFFT